MTEPITTVEAAVAELGALPMPAGSQPQPLDLERIRKTSEIATAEAAEMAAAGESLPHGVAALVDDAPALLAKVRRLRRELDRAREDVAFPERATLPDLRRQIQHHQDGKKRWRDRAETAEARVAELEAASTTEYGIRFSDSSVLREGNPLDRGEQERRLADYLPEFPAARLVQRTVHYSDWTEVDR